MARTTMQARTCVGRAAILGMTALAVVLARPTMAAADVQWKVLASDQEHVRLLVRFEGERLVPRNDDAGSPTWIEVEIPGASAVGEPGLPLLPRVARWIVAPPRGDVRVASVDPREIVDLGQGRLVPHPVASFQQDENAIAPRSRPRLVEQTSEGDGYAQFRHDAAQLVSLAEPAFVRRQRMVALRVDPVLYDAASGRIRLVRELEVVVRFEAGAALGDDPGEVDSAVLSTVLNPEMAAQWRSLAPALRAKRDRWQSGGRTPAIGDDTLGRRVDGVSVFDDSALLADPIRLRAARTGIVRVRVDDLLQAHGLPASALRRQIRIVQLRGSDPASPSYPTPLAADVPLYFLGGPDEDAAVASSDEIFFHAFRPQDDAAAREIDGDVFPPPTSHRPDHYNTDNVYFLLVEEPGATGWKRFTTSALAPSTGANPATQFRRRDVFSEDTGFQDDPANLEVERYHWNEFDEADVRRSVELRHPVPTSTVDIAFTAGAYRPAGTVNLTFSVIQSGVETTIFTRTLTALGRLFLYESQFLPGALSHGLATFRMQRLSAANLQLPVFSFLGQVELEYDAYYRASNDRIEFDLPQAAVEYDLRIPGFSRDDLLLFEVTDPRNPRAIVLDATNVGLTPDSPFTDYTLSLNVPQADGERRRFVAAPRVRFDRITSDEMLRDPVTDLFEAVSDLQVIAIGPEIFRQQAERWADFRRTRLGGRDWNLGFVDVQQIYDQFTGGLQSPDAIKAFAEWAYVNWDARALLLLGDANEDAREAGASSGPNLVPCSLHLQSFNSDTRELLASDKWYAIFDYAGTSYPNGLNTTSSMLVGRLPAGDVDQLTRMIDKIIAYEQPTASDTWRQRTLWIADDPYSSDYIGTGDPCYRYRSSEERFRTSQEYGADLAATALDSTISARMYDVDEYTVNCRAAVDPLECQSLSAVRRCYQDNHRAQLLSLIAQGWLLVSYQGHADFDVLAHEVILQNGSFTSTLPNNEGRPYLFFGMGCHVADFLRASENSPIFGPSIAETMLRSNNRGAIAVYGSSGFEFLTPNATFMEQISRAFFGGARSSSAVFGDDLRSRWVLGEVLAQAELDVFALNPFKEDEMVAQYNLLGDPLLRMDAAAPRLTARRGGASIGEGATLVADAGVGTAALALSAVDESGIARFGIVDSEGRDYAAVLPPLDLADSRRADVQLDLPVYPQRYDLEIVAYDQSYPDLARTVLTLQVPLEVELRADGEVVEDPAALVLDVQKRTALEVSFTSPVDLVESDVELVLEGADFFGREVTGSLRTWTIRADVQPRGDVPVGALTLRLQGLETVLGEEGDAGGGVAVVVRRHAVIPNPMQNDTNFTAEVQGPVERVRLSVYDLSGRSVFDRSFDGPTLLENVAGVEGRALTFRWDGRDRQGDELANGTYLYRLEVSGGGTSSRSEMGRLVIMR